MKNLEQKAIALEVKAGAEGVIEGYASRFNEVDGGGDMVAPGAYAGFINSGRKAKMLWQHDPSQPIGVWDAASEDETGLYVKGRLLTDIEKGREAARLIEAGAVDGLSIGYRTRKSDRVNGVRVLKDLDVWEVSLVTFPMLESARINAMKAAAEFEDGNTSILKRIIEEDLREAGFSNVQAKAASGAAVNKLVGMREAGSGLGELAQFMREFQTGQGD